MLDEVLTTLVVWDMQLISVVTTKSPIFFLKFGKDYTWSKIPASFVAYESRSEAFKDDESTRG